MTMVDFTQEHAEQAARSTKALGVFTEIAKTDAMIIEEMRKMLKTHLSESP